MELSNVEASRILFGFTAAYHFLFVPVTIGLMAVIALFEGVALATGRPALRVAARLLSWPFLVNFLCGVATGYPLRVQIDRHWAGYAQAVQPVVTAVFSFEGKVAPCLFALVAVFVLGWRLKPVWHWLVSTALAVVLVVQSCAILMINAWMNSPDAASLGARKTQVDTLLALADNPLLWPKVVHTIAGAWVLGGFMTLSISAWYLLRKRHVEMAGPSLRVASGFTLFALLLTAAAGHWSGERLAVHQPMKFAAIEALWDTEGHSPDLLLFAMPDQATQTNRHAIGLPGGLGWVVDTDQHPLRGLRQLAAETAGAVRHDLDRGPLDPGQPRLGHVTLLGKACCAVRPTEAEIALAADRARPHVATVFWSFRVMLFSWGVMLVLVLLVLWHDPATGRHKDRRLLRACVWAVPLPWVAIEAGWLVCEAGRQPWTITGLLSTQASVGLLSSALAVEHLGLALVFGAVMLLVNLKLHRDHLRRGPGATQWLRAGREPVRSSRVSAATPRWRPWPARAR